MKKREAKMKISNLRKDIKNGSAYLIADVEAAYTDKKTIWFSVPEKFEDWLTDDVYDAFLVAFLYPAMYYNEVLEIEGKVSSKLYDNIKNYIPSIIQTYRKGFSPLQLKVSGFAKCQKTRNIAGTGFSAGVDSFATFINRYENEPNPEYKINALFFFNVGSHGGGGEKARKIFELRYDLLKAFPQSKNLPYVKVDSNLFDFYLDYWEFDAGVFCRACAILIFEKVVSRYYLSSTHSYSELMHCNFIVSKVDLASLADTYLNPMLSTESLEIITDGAQYTRTEKTKLIVDYKPAQQLLNVCVNHWNNQNTASNCGRCSKCLRTLIALESLRKLDEFNTVFDISSYKKVSWRYKCYLRTMYNKDIFMKDNVDFALGNGVKMPSLLISHIYMIPIKVKSFVKKVVKKLLWRKK